MQRKIKNESLVFKIIVSEFVALNSLLRREYLSSAVYVLTNSLNIFHSTNIDFFQLNYVDSDQQIW